MEESKASSEYLHFGQQISISLEEDSYIYSKGFVDNNIYLQQLDNIGTYDFAGAVFRVLPQCMYSIQNDLLISSEALHHSQFHDKFLRHEESLEGEIKTNIQTYNNFKGEPVRFGTIIQLQHVMSYKFLTLIPQENAEIEKENLKIKLTEFASECSYLRIETAYKFQNEGDGLVRINDKVVFELMLPELIKTAYLNASDYFTSVKSELLPSDTLRREINVSLDHKVKWKVKSFSKFISERENILLSGDYIWITHSEEESCLVANIRNEADKIFFNTNMNDTNGLWKIENDNEREGGYVISDRLYRLRHTGSGLFLSAFEKEEEVKKAKSSSRYKNEVTYNVCLSDKKDVNNLWKFQPLHNSKKARRIERDDLCVLINNETGYSLRGAEDVNLEQDSKIIPVLKAGISEDGYFKVFKCEDSLIWGTLFLLDCMPILKEFPEFIQKHSKVSIKHENLSMIREFKKTTDLIIKCLDNLVLFCKNKLKSMITVDKQFGHVETLRQKILREQLFIDALTDILDTIFQGNFSLSKVLGLGKIDSIDSDIKVKKNKDLSLELHKSQLQTVISIAKKIYIVLSAVCNGNKDNQNYAFKFFKIFQKHAAYGLGATNAMITMLSHNEHLLLQLHKPQGLNSDRSQDSIIGHYAWLLRVIIT
jgi:Inositol 1,4,5-trisphosphate/ryanodine receptor/MIR domain/RIH domain